MAEVRLTQSEALALSRQPGHVNRAILDATTEEDIRRHAIEDGDDPDNLPTDWFPSAATVRHKLGLSQPAIAEMLQIPVGTWRNWEQGRVIPDPAARTLLRIIWREPDATRRALRASP